MGTRRSLALGALVGAVLAASNVYTGLKTAFVDGGSITAVILGYGLLRASTDRDELAARLNLVQATASTAAIMVAVIGLAGPWPALWSMGHDVPAWLLLAWGLALGVLGIALAHALRRRLVERDGLPFPTGAATAEVVRALVRAPGEGRRRAFVLATAGVVAAAIATAQGRGWVPAEIVVPLVGLGLATPLGIGVAPLVVATGALVGLRTALAMAGTGVAVWMFAVPWLHACGAIASPEFADAIAWLTWPAVGLLLGEGMHGLVEQRAVLRRTIVDLRAATPTRSMPIAIAAIVAVLAVVAIGRLALGMPILLVIAALTLAVVLSAMIGRAAGETDVAPVGAAGALGQIAVGSHGVVAALGGGSIPCGVASQTAQSLWAFATTHALGLRVRPVVGAQLLGVVVGACVAVPVYELLLATHGIGTEAMPAWGAMAWAATARAVQGSASGQGGATLVGLVALVVGFAVAHRRSRRAASAWPSPTAVAIGALTPASFSAAVLLGALALRVWSQRCPQAAATHATTIAAGAITGEALVAIALASVVALG